MNYSSPFLSVNAWTPIGTTTRYPTSGTYDVSTWSHIGGVIGLDPASATSHGVVTLFWTMNADGTGIVGVQGINLNSLIASMNQLRLMNQGPYLYLTYQPFVGPNPLAAQLFGTNIGSLLPELAGDTILVDITSAQLAAYSNATIYPCDYFAGSARVYLSAPAGVTVTLYGADLADQFWPLDSMGPGSMTTIVPMGTWLIVVSNANSAAVTYTVAVTPLVTN